MQVFNFDENNFMNLMDISKEKDKAKNAKESIANKI